MIPGDANCIGKSRDLGPVRRLIVALARAINTALIILLRRQTRAWDTIGSAVYPSYEVYSQFERLPKRHRFTHLLHSSCRGRTLFLTSQRRTSRRQPLISSCQKYTSLNYTTCPSLTNNENTRPQCFQQPNNVSLSATYIGYIQHLRTL